MAVIVSQISGPKCFKSLLVSLLAQFLLVHACHAFPFS